MAERYAGMNADLTSPYIGGFAVTPSDSTVFTQPTRAVYVGGAGNLVVTYLDGSTDTLQSVVAGTLLPIRVTKIGASSTATKISGLY